jgi:hypothetical protein
MDHELKRRIAEDLRKAGFESEMLAIEEFARRPLWRCEGSVGYRDKDQDVNRELDLLARYGLWNDVGTVQCGIRIVGEVKKTERPWVVLRERQVAEEELIDAWDNLNCHDNLPDDIALGEKLSRHSLLQENGWQGRGIHESFKPPSAASSSYGALVSVCKASESALDAEEASRAPLKKDSILFTLVKPVVVVDGPLVSAMVAADASIDVAEISSAVLRFQFRTARYTRENYHIDLVTLPYLPRYLEMCEQRVFFSGCAGGGVEIGAWRHRMTALVFENTTYKFDLDRDAMAFVAYDGDKRVLCMISAEALHYHFGAIGRRESMESAFLANRDRIEAKAREMYRAGRVDEQGRVLLHSRDFS